MKEDENPTCSHYRKKGHEEAKCWKMDLEMLPKKFKDKDKQKATTIVQDLRSDSDDKTKVIAMNIKCEFYVTSSSLHAYSSKDNVTPV